MHVRDLFDLSGRVAIVTGGATGIGLQIAEALGDLGADLVLCARNEQRREDAAAEPCGRLGVRAIGLRCNVADKDDIEELVRGTVDELGRLDVVVNSAGTSWGASAIDYPADAWRNVVDVNLTGTFLVTRAAGRVLVGQGEGGRIVNIASTAAFGGLPAETMDAVAYSASKG